MITRPTVATAFLVGVVATVAGIAVVLAMLFLARADTTGGRTPTSDQLRQALIDTIASLQLTAVPAPSATEPATSPPAPIPVRIKEAPTYWVATGMLPQPEQTARSTVLTTMQAEGWSIDKQGRVAEFLGWRTTAMRDSMVLTAAVGSEVTGVDDSPYRSRPGWTYVQISIAGREG